jgi:hypothetical protein
MQPQRRNVSQRGSGFTNLQQYVTANENNANPEIVRQRTAQAGTGLEQAQEGFGRVATQAKSGLEGIQRVNTFVGNVLRDPTAAAANQETLKRFQNLRTGTEGIANLASVYQPFTQAQAGFGSQREQLASGLRTDTTGSGLQDYIRSQRANPSLATQGENVLDRFLTESTTAGKSALQQAQTRAGEIQATALPSISGQVETLKSQVSPLSYITQQGIQSGINAPTRAEEEFITGLNKNYVAQQLGLNVGDAEYIQGQINKYQQNKNELEGIIGQSQKAIDDLNKSINYEQDIIKNSDAKINDPLATFEEKNNAQKAKETAINTIDFNRREIGKRNKAIEPNKFSLDAQTRWYNDYITRNQPTLNKLNTYNQNIGNTRQQLLQQYDLPRLQRIQALQSLSGQDLSSLLSQGVS